MNETTFNALNTFLMCQVPKTLTPYESAALSSWAVMACEAHPWLADADRWPFNIGGITALVSASHASCGFGARLLSQLEAWGEPPPRWSDAFDDYVRKHRKDPVFTLFNSLANIFPMFSAGQALKLHGVSVAIQKRLNPPSK